jgi:hypothetical protein
LPVYRYVSGAGGAKGEGGFEVAREPAQREQVESGCEGGRHEEGVRAVHGVEIMLARRQVDVPPAHIWTWAVALDEQRSDGLVMGE